tara:strand:+ start:5598 stop:8975 length:3378 start_codon:yes stop_codon:yes gene_type:complete
MATYLKGVKDYVPQLEAFKPDYKFLSDVLSVRQDRYDSNYKTINDLYSKVVYADMSREDNNTERDMYANQLSNGIKQVSGMDLSLAQNVDVAKGLFKPFFENKALVKDMTFTKMYKQEMQNANRMMKSADEKQRDRYWGDGVEDLQWQMDKFKSEDADAALGQGMPNYTENPNLYERSFEALKDSGLSIKQTTLEGDWIITTQNGTALTRQVTGYEREVVGKGQDGKPIYGDKFKKDESGNHIPIYKNPAAEYLRETVMRDPIVVNGYRVQARNKARNFANDPENIQKYGSVDAANQWWANDQLKTQTNKDMESLAEQNTAITSQENAVSNWETFKKQNNIIPGTAEDEVYLKKMLALKLSKQTRELTTERIKEAKAPASDVNQLMNKAYSQYMASVMGPLMSKAAIAYSQVDAEQTFEANPFKKMEHEHKYNLNKMAIQNSYDMNKIHAKAKYDMALVDYKNQLEVSQGGGAGIGGLGGMRSTETNANITGSSLDMNTFTYNNERLMAFGDKIHNNKAMWISDMITDLPGSFQDVDWLSQSGSEMTYNIVNPETKEVTKKTASISVAFADLKKPENVAEFTRIYNNARQKFEAVTTTESGARIYTDIPSLGIDGNTAIKLQTGYNQTYSSEVQYNDAVDEMHKQYTQVYKWAAQTDEVNIADGVPMPLLTERELAMMANNIPWNIAKEGGIEGDQYQSINNTNRRMVSKEEYIETYVNVMKLTNQQRGQLTASGASMDEDTYPFLVSENGFWNDTETTAQKYWSAYRKGQGATSRGVGISISADGTEATVRWHFNEDAARKDAANAYDGNNDKDNSGNWETGDEGMLGAMDAVMKDPDSGGENGLPGFNINSYMLGQDYEGTGQTGYKTYSTTYDHFNKSTLALDQLNSIWESTSNAPSNTVIYGIGDDRSGENFENITAEESAKAEKIYNLMINDLNTQYGKNNDRAKRPVITTSYVEKMGGPDSEKDYAGLTLTPGPDYGGKYKDVFGDTDEGKLQFQTFMEQGITIAVPQDMDNNPYKSINQVMSATDMIIQQDNEFKSEIVNGGSYSIYKGNGGQYIRQMTTYGFNANTGNIEPDPVYAEPLTIDKASLDQLVITTDSYLAQMLQKNIAAQTNWKKTQTK